MEHVSLTLALSVLGGLVLAAIVAHGWWSARKAGPRQAEPEPRPSERVEPPLSGETAAPPRPALPLEARVGPVRRAGRLDALIDALVPLTLESPVSGELILSHMPVTRRAGTKVFLIEGLNAEHGQWEVPLQSQRYGELQAGVQLASLPRCRCAPTSCPP